MTIALYKDEKDNLVRPMCALEREKYGLRFCTDGAFCGAEVLLEAGSESCCGLQAAVYSWNGTLRQTLAGIPLSASGEQRGDAGTWVRFSFPVLPAGEYVLVLEHFTGKVVLRKSLSHQDRVMLYFAGTRMEGSLVIRLCSDEDSCALLPLSEDLPETSLPDAMPDTWTATDGLGRNLPVFGETREYRTDKYVGLFFWTWHSLFSVNPSANVTEILAEHPDILPDYHREEWGDKFSYFWNEPIYGYYNGLDPWVFRKQAELLANAGVDVIVFDNSNGVMTFLDGMLMLLETFSRARADGVNTPRISFILPFWDYKSSNIQLKEFYRAVYAVGKYQDLWFYWDGKPLVMGYPDLLDQHDPLEAEILDFFTFRPAQPSYITGQERPGQWGWLSLYPQKIYVKQDGTPEQMTVGVAQNYSKELGLTAMNGKNVFGRTYSALLEGYDPQENAKLYGANFAEQFEYALQVDPEFIFITGWNEWRAGRYETWMGVENAFPDTFDDTYSRDIEPSKGDLKDHYYYQMISYIRRYKGVRPSPKASPEITVDWSGKQDSWEGVQPYFAAYPGNTFDRDCRGYDTHYYMDSSGRNDIVGAKVARDQDYVYFMAETADVLTPATGPAWMRLFFTVEGQDKPCWESFSYVVNRASPSEKALLERSLGGWDWEPVSEVDYLVLGNRLQLRIPRSILGISDEDFAIRFKWSDNMQKDGDPLDFYVSGDAAPGGRFQYRYSTVD